MGTITPMLDTLLPQVLGRAGDVARVGARAASGPLAALRPVSGEMAMPARGGALAYPGRESSSGSVRGAAATGARASAAGTDPPSARDIARAIAGRPAAGTRSAELHLSRGGGALARLLAEVATARDSGSVLAAGPLVAAGAAPRPADIPALLAQQLADSGLFYESHLAAWVRGQFPRSRLMREPQARLGTPSGQAGPADAPGSAPSANSAGPANAGAMMIDPRLAALVRQQIELLASGVFQWQGEAWTGAPMRWTVERENDNAPSGSDTPAPITTALSLDLPGIGAFEARLRLAGDGVAVTTWAERGTGRDLISADLETLRRRLRAAGFGESSVHLMTEPAT